MEEDRAGQHGCKRDRLARTRLSEPRVSAGATEDAQTISDQHQYWATRTLSLSLPQELMIGKIARQESMTNSMLPLQRTIELPRGW